MRIGALAAGVVLLATACGSGEGSPSKGEHSVRVTREDGSQVKLPHEVHAWCGPGPFAPQAESETAPDPPKPRELWVLAGRFPPEEEHPERTTLWVFSRPTKEIERAPRVKFPDDEGLHASFFVYDAETENELSSYEEAAKGVLQVKEWGCEKGDTVRISVDATLDSEFHDMPSAQVVGDIEAVIGDPLPIPE